MVLCAGFAGGCLSVDTPPGAAVQPALVSRSPRPVSAGLVRVGLPLLFGFAQQAARVSVAAASARRRAGGDCRCGSPRAKSENDDGARRKRSAALPGSTAGGRVATSA